MGRAMPIRTWVGLLLLAAAALVLPDYLADRAGLPIAGASLGLITLASLQATVSFGPRVGIVGGIAMGAASTLAALASGHVALIVTLMTIVAALFGLTAFRGWQKAFTLYPVALAFAVCQSPLATTGGAVAVGLVTAGFTAAVALLAWLLTRHGAPLTTTPPVRSTARVTGYSAMLALAALMTTTVALTQSWGHAGGWLIMTPFIVLQPYMQDGFSRSLRRAAGTVSGFAIAIAIGAVLTSTTALVAIGSAFGMAGFWASLKRLDYAVVVALITPAVVLLDGASGSVEATAAYRLAATILGVGISLTLMAISLPVYRRAAHAHQLDRF